MSLYATTTREVFGINLKNELACNKEQDANLSQQEKKYSADAMDTWRNGYAPINFNCVLTNVTNT